MFPLKKIITTIALVALVATFIPISLLSALTVQEAVNSLQVTDPSLPSVTNPKGNIGYLLANIFWKSTDPGYLPSKLGTIKPAYLDISGLNIWTQSGSDTYLTTITGSVGIGTTNPGAKLEVAGQIKITGGTPGSGKVLVSDASGLASWSTTAPLYSYSETDPAWTIASTNYYTKTNLQTSGQSSVHYGNLTNMITASSLLSGILSSIDWGIFNNKIGGSGIVNYLSKFTTAGTIGNSLVYDNGTSIGIGTDTPSSTLTISGTIAGLNRFALTYPTTSVYDDTTSNTPYSQLSADSFHTNGLGMGQMFIEGRAIDANGSIYIGMGVAGGQAASNIAIGTDSALYVDTSGNTTFTKPVTAATPTAGTHLATKNYVDAAVGAVGGGGKTQSVVLTGVGTWTVPTGVTGVEVILVGGGGGGGGGSTTSTPFGTNGGGGGNTTFGSLTAYGGGGGGGGTAYYSNTSGNAGAGGGPGGGSGLGDNNSGCPADLSIVNGKTSFTNFGGGGGGSECSAGGLSGYSFHRKTVAKAGGGSFSNTYGAGGNGSVNGGAGGGGGEVIRTIIPVSGSVSYSVGSGGAGGTGAGGNGVAGAEGYIQIQYVY